MNTTSMGIKIEAMKRPPGTVMRLKRMGSFHQTRLSFMRSLLRLMKNEGWELSRPIWRIDTKGVGVAVYQAKGPVRTYSVVAFSHDLDPSKRTDRSIATEWDATFATFDGIPSEEDLERLSLNVPKQEAGRVSDTELSISRANKSSRLFDHVVDRLAAGQQPELELIESVGYLMRTTAVYGSAKFGGASRDKIKDRPEVSRPFHVEMLSVFMTRAFTVDLVEHLARVKAPETATVIEPSLRRSIGVGNSTGLGLAPFLVNHPTLIHNWINARETALARVRANETASTDKIEDFREALASASNSIANWTTTDEAQTSLIAELCTDLGSLQAHVDDMDFNQQSPWNELYQWGENNLNLEAQELLVSTLIEPFGDLVDDLLDSMSSDEDSAFRIDGQMTVGGLRNILSTRYRWALETDFAAEDAHSFFWYVSTNKGEPRLGERADEEEADDYETPLDVGRQVQILSQALASLPEDQRIAEFLVSSPEYRQIARRIQIIDKHPYGEIYDNLISSSVRPMDMLRCKLSFFGAIDFDPRSVRWIRINMYKNAPFPNELSGETHDNWAYS